MGLLNDYRFNDIRKLSSKNVIKIFFPFYDRLRGLNLFDEKKDLEIQLNSK